MCWTDARELIAMATTLGRVKVLHVEMTHTSSALLERIDGTTFDLGDLLRDPDTGLTWQLGSFDLVSWKNPEHIRLRASIQIRAIGHSEVLPTGKEVEVIRPSPGEKGP
jgi:hypothetical protein